MTEGKKGQKREDRMKKMKKNKEITAGKKKEKKESCIIEKSKTIGKQRQGKKTIKNPIKVDLLYRIKEENILY